ncbi:YsgD/CorL family protein [Klebsiella sp. 119743]
MMSLWDALRMNMMISYQELVRTFPKRTFALDTPSRCWLNFLSFRNNS